MDGFQLINSWIIVSKEKKDSCIGSNKIFHRVEMDR